MKKIFLVFVIGLMLTGCNKALKCTSESSSKTMNIKRVYKIYSNNNDISKVNTSVTYELLDDKLNENFELSVIALKSDYESKNLEYNYTNKGKKHTFDVIYNIDSLSDKVFNEVFGTKNLTEYKQKLVDQGYKCK